MGQRKRHRAIEPCQGQDSFGVGDLKHVSRLVVTSLGWVQTLKNISVSQRSCDSYLESTAKDI